MSDFTNDHVHLVERLRHLLHKYETVVHGSHALCNYGGVEQYQRDAAEMRLHRAWRDLQKDLQAMSAPCPDTCICRSCQKDDLAQLEEAKKAGGMRIPIR